MKFVAMNSIEGMVLNSEYLSKLFIELQLLQAHYYLTLLRDRNNRLKWSCKHNKISFLQQYAKFGLIIKCQRYYLLTLWRNYILVFMKTFAFTALDYWI